jgi:hypothetical protein
VKAKTAEILNRFTEHGLQIALKIGSIVCSCVSNQKVNVLKAIVVDFLNLLNRKSYRHSLLFSDHVHVSCEVVIAVARFSETSVHIFNAILRNFPIAAVRPRNLKPAMLYFNAFYLLV